MTGGELEGMKGSRYLEVRLKGEVNLSQEPNPSGIKTERDVSQPK